LRSNNKRLSPRYYLSTDAIFWDGSGGDTFVEGVGAVIKIMKTDKI